MASVKVEPKVVHATCVVERSFSKPADVVFTALSDPNKVRKWMGGNEFSELLEFVSEFREGGKQVVKYKMGPKTPIAGAVITNEAWFQQIVPGERICPSCQQTFTSTGKTLAAYNGALGLEGHACPHCGNLVSFRRPSPDGL